MIKQVLLLFTVLQITCP